MAILKNAGKRLHHFPVRTNGAEEFGARVSLAPGAQLDVPDWYAEALLEEKGWAARIEAGAVELVSSEGRKRR